MNEVPKLPDLKNLKERQRQWLIQQLKLKGHGSRSSLAKHLNVRNDAITRMTNLTSEKEAREIHVEDLLGMAAFFGSIPPGLENVVPSDQKDIVHNLKLRSHESLLARPKDATNMSGNEQRVSEATSGASLVGEVRDLPIYGTAQGGRGAMLLSEKAVAWTVRPPSLFKVAAGYGMIVMGDSMSPEHRAGSTALVNPHLPPQAGITCVFRNVADEGVILREFERETSDLWHVKQHRPPRSLTLKKSEWQAFGQTTGNYR